MKRHNTQRLRTPKKLVLRGETIIQLTFKQLKDAAGGAGPTSGDAFSCIKTVCGSPSDAC
jgi:hypothetical protein